MEVIGEIKVCVVVNLKGCDDEDEFDLDVDDDEFEDLDFDFILGDDE